ncbi:Uncharacterised protein [uncultured archaeon]|nr:Uncharacterised protein [uncultured archaeon]
MNTRENPLKIKVFCDLSQGHEFAMRQNSLRYLVLGADFDGNSIDILAEIFALLPNLLLLFVIIWGDLVKIFLTIAKIILTCLDCGEVRFKTNEEYEKNMKIKG